MRRATRSSEGPNVRSAAMLLVATLVATLAAACMGSGRAPSPAVPPPALLDTSHVGWSRPAPERYRVRIETTKGAFTLEIVRAFAPRGADRFYNLVRAGFYDDSRLSRIVPGFIAQFGIPGDPRVAAVWKDRRIADDPVRASNVRGAIAYAMTGPDTRTHQLFISLVDNARLDAQGFAPLGRVVEGMDVVDRLYGGYGERSGGGMRAGRQGRAMSEGNAYFDAEFPLLDRLMRARVEAP